MRLLLDTQCWLWWFSQPEKLNEKVIEQIADETNEVWFSVASVWELHNQKKELAKSKKVRIILGGGGRKSKLSPESQIILTLTYLRHLTTF